MTTFTENASSHGFAPLFHTPAPPLLLRSSSSSHATAPHLLLIAPHLLLICSSKFVLGIHLVRVFDVLYTYEIILGVKMLFSMQGCSQGVQEVNVRSIAI